MILSVNWECSSLVRAKLHQNQKFDLLVCLFQSNASTICDVYTDAAAIRWGLSKSTWFATKETLCFTLQIATLQSGRSKNSNDITTTTYNFVDKRDMSVGIKRAKS